MKLTINAKPHDVAAKYREVRLVHYLRDHLGLTGTKFGCGAAQCGACTVHVDGAAKRSCQLDVGDLEGSEVTTIEGLAGSHPQAPLHPVQQAWLDERVAQCGYCQPGQIMSAAALLAINRRPDEAAIREFMEGNLCRCGTYERILKAVKRAARKGGPR
jgi:isoquinoline 1-oxidoreductase alpha subunit